MSQFLVLASIISATIFGDYLLKIASQKEDVWPIVILAIFLYAMPAFGWLHLMKTQSLAQIGVLYSSGTILALFVMSIFVFKEPLSNRDIVAGLFSILAIIAYNN